MVNPDVLVVGAGPTGLTLACELLRHGCSCRVVETLEAPVTTSKAAVVHSRTMEVFGNLGIAQTIPRSARDPFAGSMRSPGASGWPT